MNADSLVYRVTMHIMKLCAHSPLLSISFKHFQASACTLLPLFLSPLPWIWLISQGTFHSKLMWHWVTMWSIHGDLCNICHKGYSVLLKENYVSSQIIPLSGTEVLYCSSKGRHRRLRYCVTWKAIKVLKTLVPDGFNLHQSLYSSQS